jgi:hypothetical protein
MPKFSLLTILKVLIGTIFIVSCAKPDHGQATPPPGKHNTFSVQENNVSSDVNGKVEINITFTGLDGIVYLAIRKSGAGSFSEQVNKNQLSNSYQYIYNIQDDDPATFQLVLHVHYSDGTDSQNTNVVVTNEKGAADSGTRAKLVVKKIIRIARVTGGAIFGEGFPSPNKTDQVWDVGGCDLGIIWEMDPGKYGIFFGDTFGSDFKPNPANPGPNGSNWRSNVLGFSTNTDLDQDIVFDSMATGIDGKAKELLPGAKTGSTSSIPTAAIRANGVDYVHCFKVDSWNPNLITQYSTLYKSKDEGQTWSRVQGVTFSSSSRFALVGFFKKDGYVYMIGTPAYRNRPAYLARFKEADIEHISNYEYWNGTNKEWVKGDENQATVLIDATVGELSFIYNETYKKWIIAYFNAAEYNITMRIAEDITGPWDTKFVLATGADYPQLYGSYFHPLSTKGDYLYFTMSMWEPYNVFLMKVELSDK